MRTLLPGRAARAALALLHAYDGARLPDAVARAAADLLPGTTVAVHRAGPVGGSADLVARAVARPGQPAHGPGGTALALIDGTGTARSVVSVSAPGGRRLRRRQRLLLESLAEAVAVVPHRDGAPATGGRELVRASAARLAELAPTAAVDDLAAELHVTGRALAVLLGSAAATPATTAAPDGGPLASAASRVTTDWTTTGLLP